MASSNGSRLNQTIQSEAFLDVSNKSCQQLIKEENIKVEKEESIVNQNVDETRISDYDLSQNDPTNYDGKSHEKTDDIKQENNGALVATLKTENLEEEMPTRIWAINTPTNKFAITSDDSGAQIRAMIRKRVRNRLRNHQPQNEFDSIEDYTNKVSHVSSYADSEQSRPPSHKRKNNVRKEINMHSDTSEQTDDYQVSFCVSDNDSLFDNVKKPNFSRRKKLSRPTKKKCHRPLFWDQDDSENYNLDSGYELGTGSFQPWTQTRENLKRIVEELPITDQSSMKCSVCDIVFDCLSKLHKHTRDIHKVFVCACAQEFICERRFIMHSAFCDLFIAFRSVLERKTTLKCPDCTVVVHSRNLGKHLKEVHNASDEHGPFSCHVCSVSFGNEEYFIQHRSKFHIEDEEPLTCPFCTEICLNKTSIYEHLNKLECILKQQQEFSIDVALTCPLCEHTDRGQQLLEHIYTHFSDPDKLPIKQPFKKKTRAKRTPTETMALTDTKEDKEIKAVKKKKKKRYKSKSEADIICSVCGQMLAGLKSLELHMWRKHKIQPDQCLPCKKCRRIYTSEQSLEKHMKKCDGSGPPKKQKRKRREAKTCEICSKVIMAEYSFNKHMDMHLGVFRFKCDYCGKQLRSKYDKEVHERTHTGEKPYLCRFCGKGFGDRSNRKVHERKKHDETKEEVKFCNTDQKLLKRSIGENPVILYGHPLPNLLEDHG